MQPRRLRILIAAWVVLLLALPGLAWLAGARQPVLENTPKAEFPAINRSSLPNEKTYPRLEAAILDRLPFRGRALETRGRIDVQVFGDSTNAEVQLGKHGWLFFGPDTQACTPAEAPKSNPADAFDLVARSIVASGRRAGVMIAGSKTVAMRAELRDTQAKRELACAAALERSVQARLRTTPGGLDIQPQLDAIRAEGRPTFLQNDTHWTPESRLVFLRAVLNRIRPGLADRASLQLASEPIDYAGDLGRFLGIPLTEPVRTIGADNLPNPDPARIGLAGDSQMNFSLLWPGPDGKTVAEKALPGSPSCAVENMHLAACDAVIVQARTLILEVVARNVRAFTEACWRPISLVASDRAGTPARWRTGDVSPPGDLRTAQATTTVGLASPSADRSDVPRLFRVPIDRFPKDPGGAPVAVDLAQTPASGDPIPCLTPQQLVEGGSLFIPVPAGRSVRSISVDLKAPVGTVLGRPQEIILDGTTAPKQR